MDLARTILVIDDEENLRRSLSLILQRAGYSVTTAGNAQEAWLALSAGVFDLVLLDLKMPGVSGLELLPQIWQKYPESPVVIITAHATLESAIEAIRGGARDYLLKPINPAQILSRVDEILSSKDQNKRRQEILEEMQRLVAELGQLELTDLGPQTKSTPAFAGDQSRILRFGPFVVDMHARIAQMDGRPLPLSPTAFNYLVTLIRHSPQTVDYEILVRESQGFETTPIEAYEMARWRIHELRKAVESDSRRPKHIITIRGAGYRLVTEPGE
jgi:DNA-binding response OmpR family regulator